MRVLIVDDEKIIREGLCAMIPWQEYGFQVPDTADNGAKALEIMETTSYDVLVTDVRMPKIDGLALCQAVHNLYPDCVIIILSGYGDFQYAQTAIEYGVRRYLLKPVDESKLTEVLLQIRQNHRRKPAESATGIDAQFYDCKLPVAQNADQIWISTTDAGKSAARALAKGDMAGVTGIIGSFVRKLDSIKAPYNQRIERCNSFLAPLIKMAKNLKIEEITGLDDICEEYQLFNSETLAQLYDRLISLAMFMSRHISARLTEGNVRTSDQMAAYIRNNYHTKLSTASLAEHFHLSAAYCGRLFKEEQGISIIQYLHKTRIEQAKQLLSQTDDKLEYIALQVGYLEVSSFYSQFKRLVDMTPEQYRRLSGK